MNVEAVTWSPKELPSYELFRDYCRMIGVKPADFETWLNTNRTISEVNILQ